MKNHLWIITLALGLIIASSSAQTIDTLQGIDIQRIAVAGLQENSLQLTLAHQDLISQNSVQASADQWYQHTVIQAIAVAGLQENEKALAQAFKNLVTPTNANLIVQERHHNWFQQIDIQRIAVAGLQENTVELAAAYQNLFHHSFNVEAVAR